MLFIWLPENTTLYADLDESMYKNVFPSLSMTSYNDCTCSPFLFSWILYKQHVIILIFNRESLLLISLKDLMIFWNTTLRWLEWGETKTFFDLFTTVSFRKRHKMYRSNSKLEKMQLSMVLSDGIVLPEESAGLVVVELRASSIVIPIPWVDPVELKSLVVELSWKKRLLLMLSETAAGLVGEELPASSKLGFIS